MRSDKLEGGRRSKRSNVSHELSERRIRRLERSYGGERHIVFTNLNMSFRCLNFRYILYLIHILKIAARRTL